MLFSLTLAEPIYAELGWSRPGVSTGKIDQLYYVYMSWKDVALHLGVSVKPLEKRRNEFGNCSKYTTISDEELCAVAMEVLENLPDAGETCFTVACRQHNTFVQG